MEMNAKIPEICWPAQTRTITLSLGLLDDENEGGTADDWVDAIDRGGLTRVNEITSGISCHGKLELRKH